MRLAIFTVLVSGLLATASAAAPNGFSAHRFNGRDPVQSGTVTTFHVLPGDCSDVTYGDGRGESDCYNGNLRSRLAYRNHARLGDAMQYQMEIMVPPGFRYGGGPNRRSKLEVAEWQRINTIKNHIHQLHLDSVKGLTFDDVRCIAPNALSQWNRVTVQVKWSMNDDGLLRVLCNDKVVVHRQGRTAIPPDCGAPQVFQCIPKYQEPEKPIQFQIGILFRGYGTRARQDGLNPKGRIAPPEGFTVQMRNVKVSRIRFN